MENSGISMETELQQFNENSRFGAFFGKDSAIGQDYSLYKEARMKFIFIYAD